MSLQGVRAFVAVAEQGSFAAAARLLGVSQPTISTAVARLEEHAGARLLLRERGGVSLTDHGRRILTQAKRLVAAADELDRTLTAGGAPSLTMGFMGEAASSVTRAIVATAQRYLGAPVRLRRFDFDDPTCGLASGASDVAIVWPPLSADYLDQLVVTSDRRAIAVPLGDELAHRAELAPDDLAGRDWVVPRSRDPRWRAFRHPRTLGITRVGALVDSGSVEETLELVASGFGIALLSESTDQHYARAGVVIVPLAGDQRCTAALAWRRDTDDPLVKRIVDDLRRQRRCPPSRVLEKGLR